MYYNSSFFAQSGNWLVFRTSPKPKPSLSDFEKIRARLDPLVQKRKDLDTRLERVDLKLKKPTLKNLVKVAMEERKALLQYERDQVVSDIATFGEQQREIVNKVVLVSW